MAAVESLRKQKKRQEVVRGQIAQRTAERNGCFVMPDKDDAFFRRTPMLACDGNIKQMEHPAK